MGIQELFNAYLKQEGVGKYFQENDDIEHCDIAHQDYYTDEIH